MINKAATQDRITKLDVPIVVAVADILFVMHDRKGVVSAGRRPHRRT